MKVAIEDIVMWAETTNRPLFTSAMKRVRAMQKRGKDPIVMWLPRNVIAVVAAPKSPAVVRKRTRRK